MTPRVVVAQPLVWGVCNVIRSGLAEQLGREFRPGYAIPAEAREGWTRKLREGHGRFAGDVAFLLRKTGSGPEAWEGE